MSATSLSATTAGPAEFALPDDFSTNKFGIQWSFFAPGPDEMKRVKYENRSLLIAAKGERAYCRVGFTPTQMSGTAAWPISAMMMPRA